MNGAVVAVRRRLAALAEIKTPEATAFLTPGLRAWRGWMGILIVIALGHTVLGHWRWLTERFFYLQDLPIAALMLALLTSLYFVKPAWAPSWSIAPSWRTVGLIALAVIAFCWAGTFLIYDNYALSLDEFMARFDARIMAAGQLAAPVPEAWRPLVPALMPQFRLGVPGNAYWISSYLPVNAAFLALASKLGAESLMAPVWAAVSVLATYGVGRRLWPEKPEAGLLAAVLVATSPQVLVTAMTPYAMSAHLALNMVWLWLVLRGGKLGHGAAAGVAFLATGLHQLIFHPLFAAPFVLEMWLGRRWKPALWHTCAYAVIGLFWTLYPSLLLQALGASSVAAAASGQFGMIPKALALLRHFDPTGLGMMTKNLVRFFTWQSLLTVPLALSAAIPAFRAGGAVRALVLGVVLTTVAMLILLPYQGHGWGYRYLHGLIGSVCLLAAWNWSRMGAADRAGRAQARRAVFAGAALLSAIVLLPIRAAQAHAFEHPYAEAERRIQALHADVVLIDDTGVAFGGDLVRNDPWLRGPITLRAGSLTTGQLVALCSRRRTGWFLPSDAAALGIATARLPPGGRVPTSCRAAMAR